MHSVSIVGCGYAGLRLAQRLKSPEVRIRGFAKSAPRLAQIAAADLQPIGIDLDEPPASIDFGGEWIYYCVPPTPVGDRDARLERLLERTTGRPRRIVYMSTTGVYGDQCGGSVDEETPPSPQSERATR